MAFLAFIIRKGFVYKNNFRMLAAIQANHAAFPGRPYSTIKVYLLVITAFIINLCTAYICGRVGHFKFYENKRLAPISITSPCCLL